MSNLAPVPHEAERVGNGYERKIAAGLPGERGPLRFQEGVGTDTDVPNEFAKGAMQGYATAPGRPNHNLNVYEKSAEETTHERAHVGSAAWVESPQFLGEFAGEAFGDHGVVKYTEADRSGSRYERRNPARVTD